MNVLLGSQLNYAQSVLLKNSVDDTHRLVGDLRRQGLDANSRLSNDLSMLRYTLNVDCPLSAKGLIMNGANVNEMVSVPNMGQYGILTLVIKKSYLNTAYPSTWGDVAILMINNYMASITYTPAHEGEFEVDTDSPFYEALASATQSYGGNRSILDAILAKRPDFINRIKVDQFLHQPQRTPLMFAITNGDVSLVHYLLQKPGININQAINYEGTGQMVTALQWATKWKFVDANHNEIYEIIYREVYGRPSR
ncbi:MAG: ankyrin repeat domain-containing protein [Verrucomicrobia bacterium]|nr:ankyrin repeat domain-containing protein [Verrucomicrobiota bacterium]